MRPHVFALILALVIASPAAADIVDSKTERQLSLSGTNFRIVIPREDWVVTREQTRNDGSSVYYALASAKRDLTLWVFIDRTLTCQSAKACLEMALKNKAYDGAKNMKFSDHEGFNVVQFTLEPPKDGAMQQHLIAVTYVDGAWVDVHLLQAAKAGTSPESLPAALKLISIK